MRPVLWIPYCPPWNLLIKFSSRKLTKLNANELWTFKIKNLKKQLMHSTRKPTSFNSARRNSSINRADVLQSLFTINLEAYNVVMQKICKALN